MTGIVAGSAALMGAATGWWGAVVVALLAVVAAAAAPQRPCWAIYAVAELKPILRRPKLVALSRALRPLWS